MGREWGAWEVEIIIKIQKGRNMFIDMHVHPALNQSIKDSELEELRHNTLDIRKNGTTLEHIFNQMKCAGLDYLSYFQKDYRTQRWKSAGKQ